MLAYTHVSKGEFRLVEKSRPGLKNPKDAIVRVTLASICTSDLHIKHGSVPRAVPGITVGHEMVGDCDEILALIADGRIDTTPLITHTFPLEDIEAAYCLFESKAEGVIKVAVRP